MGAFVAAVDAGTVFVIMAPGFSAVGAPAASVPLLPIVDLCHLAVVADVHAVSVSPGMAALVSAAGTETVFILMGQCLAAEAALAVVGSLLPQVVYF